MKNKISIAMLGAGILTSMLLTGCGGGGGGGGSSSADTSITVTPSLGQFSEGTQVKLKKADNSDLASGTIGADGKSTISLPGSHTGPVIVEVLGGDGVQYYDEGTKSLQNFIAGKKLRACMPSPKAQVGVTALTNAAVAKLGDNPTADQINSANDKVAKVFGLADILEAPTTVHGSTGKTLNIATLGDKYALVLAALAKAAIHSGNAADVSDALAKDLKDDKLDGLEGSTPVTTYYAPTSIETKYQEAAEDLADTTSEMTIAMTPMVMKRDVSDPVTVSTPSALSQAKAMFAALRTDLHSFSNGSKTGFLDTQATRMNVDLNANVAPEMKKVAHRIGALSLAMGVYEDGLAYTPGNTNNLFVLGNTLNYTDGFLGDVWNGKGSYNYCSTDSATPGSIHTVTCFHAGSNSADWANNRIKLVKFVLTGTSPHNYTYTATRYNMSWPAQVVTLAASVPTGIGSVSKTVSGTTTTGFAINGTLPPSAADLTTGVDTIVISAVRTVLGTLPNNYHYALSGSVSTSNQAAPTKIVTVSLDNGSYIDLDETTGQGGNKILAAKLIGTAKTVATQFTGTLEMSNFMSNGNGQNYAPTSVVFTGGISDTSPGGAGQILTGQLAAGMTGYGAYHSDMADSPTNYQHVTATFTGTVQAPSRPLMTLVVAVARTGLHTDAITVNYSYGATSITGSGTVDGANPANDTLTLSNQDGIQLVINNGSNTTTVTKSGATLATITNDSIHYNDGVSESLM